MLVFLYSVAIGIDVFVLLLSQDEIYENSIVLEVTAVKGWNIHQVVLLLLFRNAFQ